MITSTLLPPPQPRGVDLSLPTCGETRCHGRGTCTLRVGGGGALVCECILGYRGDACQDTVNEAVSLPLTLGVLGVLLGLVALAFILAKVRQKQKKKRRMELNTAELGDNVAV